MKKKLLSLVCVLALTLACVAPASAAADGPLSMSSGFVGSLSDSVTVAVSLEEAAANGAFTLTYNADCLTLAEVSAPAPDAAEINGPAGAEGLSAGAALEPGTVRAAFAYDGTGTPGDRVLVCSFKVTGTLPSRLVFTADDVSVHGGNGEVWTEPFELYVNVYSMGGGSDGAGSAAGPEKETTKSEDGTVGITEKDADGNITSVEVIVPEGADGTVAAPVEMSAAESSADAPDVHILIEGGGSAQVNIPVSNCGPGVVAVTVEPDGSMKIVRDCVPTENGILLTVDGEATVRLIDNGVHFDDVASGSWAEDAIAFVSARELFRGTGDAEFSPNGTMTRGMTATVLYRLAYEPEGTSSGFADVSGGAYYADAVNWASENGIVNGYDASTFAPDDNVTREQLVTILYRYAKVMGLGTDAVGVLDGFADAGEVSGYAVDAMSWATGAGLINGVDASHLDPGGSATRAQVAAILMRFCEKIVH